MNLKAIFPTGTTELTVNGLHQWDYGRKLEIHAADLPAVVEIHFACPGMEEAIVRVGSAVGGVVTVSIPDRCLEQYAPITAWVYEVGETYGQTIKALTLNVMKRARPQAAETLTPEIRDEYTEAVGAMNEAVETLRGGGVKVNEAAEADHADNADSAGMVACYAVDSLDTLNSLAEQNQTCGVNFHADVDLELFIVPQYSKGILSGQDKAAVLIVTDNRGAIYAAYKGNEAKWVNGQKLEQKEVSDTKYFYYDLPTGKVNLDSTFTADFDQVSHLKVTYCDEYGKKFTVELPVQRGYMGTATVIESVATDDRSFVQVELSSDLTSISIHRWNWYGESSTLSPDDTTVWVQKIYGHLS